MENSNNLVGNFFLIFLKKEENVIDTSQYYVTEEEK